MGICKSSEKDKKNEISTEIQFHPITPSQLLNEKQNDTTREDANDSPQSNCQNLVVKYFPVMLNQKEDLMKHFSKLDNQQIDNLQIILNSKGIKIIEFKKEGNLGKLFVAKDKDLREVALRVIETPSEVKLQSCQNELKNMKMVLSKHVVKVYDGFHNQNCQLFFMVIEYCKKSLLDRISPHKYLSEEEIIKIFSQILIGIKDINQQRIILSEFGPFSILFSDDDQVKINGFHSSIFFEGNQTQKTVEGYITEQSSPEYQKGQITLYSDIFSAGLILYKMCFPEATFQQLKDLSNGQSEIENGKFPKLIQIAYKMMKQIPEERPSYSDIYDSLNEHQASGSLINNIKQYFNDCDIYQIACISQELNNKQIQITKVLGEGPLAKNYLAINSKNEEVVLKVLKAKSVQEIELCKDEVKHMQMVGFSEYVVKVFDSFYIDGTHLFFVVQELCPGGTLSALLKNEQKKLNQNEIIDISCQLLQGIIDINSKNIIHSNIDPYCIFFSKSGKVKIVGFRYSTYIEESYQSAPQNYSFNRYSPLEQKNGKVNRKSDLFTAGVVISEICGVQLNKSDQIDQVLRTLDYDKHPFPKILQIALKLVEEVPNKRESAENIIQQLQQIQFQSKQEIDQSRELKTKQFIKEYLIHKNISEEDICQIASLISSKVDVQKKLMGNPDSQRIVIESINENKEKVVLSIEVVKKNDFDSLNKKMEYQKKMELWKKYSNDKIVKLLYHCWRGEVLISIIEYFDENLGERMSKTPKLTKQQILNMFRQIAESLLYLHSENIIHNNLQMENIFINSNDQIKISNFSCVAQYDPYEQVSSEKKQINKETDIYYLANIFLKIIDSDSKYFQKMEIQIPYNLIEGNKYPELKDLIDLICKMMIPEIEDRIKVKGVIEEIKNIQNQMNSNLDEEIKEYLQAEMNEEQINKTLSILKEKYSPSKILGKGQSGIVLECIDNFNQETTIAIKIVNSRNPKVLEKCEQEAKNIRKIDSNHVIKLISSQNNEDCGSYFFVFEKCSQNLQQFLNKSSLAERYIKQFMNEIIQGLIDIHDKNIVHSDLKFDNLLLTKDQKIKICDFGFSVQLPDSKSIFQSKGKNMQNCSPEQMNDRVQKESDIFAVGVILAQMIFPNMVLKDYINLKSHPFLPRTRENFQNLIDLAQKLIAIKPEDRISLKEALKILNS